MAGLLPDAYDPTVAHVDVHFDRLGRPGGGRLRAVEDEPGVAAEETQLGRLGLAAGLALVASFAASALWRRHRLLPETVFSDLLVWGWLRRVYTERQISRALASLDRLGASEASRTAPSSSTSSPSRWTSAILICTGTRAGWLGTLPGRPGG